MENVKMNYETLLRIEKYLGRKLTDKEAVFGYQNGAIALVRYLQDKLWNVFVDPSENILGNFDFEVDESGEPCEEPVKDSVTLVRENMPKSASPWLKIAEDLMNVDDVIAAYIIKGVDHPITIDEEVGDILDIIKDQTVETLAKKLKDTHEKIELPQEILDEVCEYLWNNFNNVSIKIVNGVIEVH